jgi:hydrogenase/urease accessory protein HupE
VRINLDVVEMINKQLPANKQVSLRWALEVGLGIEVYDLTFTDSKVGRAMIKLAPSVETDGDAFSNALSIILIYKASIFAVGVIGEEAPDELRKARYPVGFKVKTLLLRRSGFTGEFNGQDAAFAQRLLIAVTERKTSDNLDDMLVNR